MSKKALRTTVEVPIRFGREEELEQRLFNLAETQHFLFTRNQERSVMVGDGLLTLIIVWDKEIDYHQWKKDFTQFQEAFADVLLWEKAQITSKPVELWSSHDNHWS